jgi:hypothetical protein
MPLTYRDFKRMMKIMQLRHGRASLSIGTPLGNLVGSSFTTDFEIWMKGALEVERLSLRELCEGTC